MKAARAILESQLYHNHSQAEVEPGQEDKV